MAAARSRQEKPLGPFIIPASIALAAITSWNGWPGLALIWLGFVISAFTYPAPPATKMPTPAEESMLRKYRFWSGLKTSLLIPGRGWLPGWPLQYSWLLAVASGLCALAIPVTEPSLPEGMHWLNALTVFVLIAQLSDSRRQQMVAEDVCPGTRTKDLIDLVREKPHAVLIPGISALVFALVASIVAAPFVPERAWALIVGASLALPLLATFNQVSHRALDHWRIVVAERARWKERWKQIKMDPGPRLLDRRTLGDPDNPSVIIDTFRAQAGSGSAQFLTLSEKIVPLLEGRFRVAVASVPSEDTQGQPMSGTVNSIKFDVIQFPSDAMPDPCDAATSVEVMTELIRAAFAWMGEQAGITPGYSTLELISTAGTSEEPSPQAWAISLTNVAAKSTRSQQLGMLSAIIGAPALLDHRANGGAGVLFVGALFDAVLDPQTGFSTKAFDEMNQEDAWTARWNELIKQGDNPPVPQFPTASTQRLANGVEIEQLAFVTLQGQPPQQFFDVEKKLPTALNGAPFASLAGWHHGAGARKGERHAQAFVARWSSSQVPSRPDDLEPVPGSQAPDWVLAGLLNSAFKAARLAGRPELVSAVALTKSSSRGHIWKLHVRLYDGVTLSDVRTAARRIKETWASSWLRVAEATDGCYIYAGALQDKVELKSSGIAKEIDALDWEQIFIDSKISGIGGSMPRLVSTSKLEHNQQVKKLRFDLTGTGLVFAKFKGERASLEANSGNAFVEARQVKNKPQEIDLMVCEIDPMPEKSDYDWDYIDNATGIPFATGVEGEPIAYDFRADAHLLVAGASGGGKSVLLQSLIYGALVRGYEIYIADPTKGGADFQFAAPYAKSITAEVYEAAAMMKSIYAEVVRRKNVNSAHGVGNYRDLPEDIRPKHIVLVLDEFTSLMQPDPLPTKSDDPELQAEYDQALALNKAKTEIGIYTGKIAREARSAGVTLFLATQKLTAKLLDSIPGAGDLKVNLSRLLLGKATFGEKQSALKNATEAPELGTSIPRGRGLFEASGSPTAIIQAWYNPAEQRILAEKLSERLDPLLDSERLDVSPFLAAPVDMGPAVIDYVLEDPDDVVELDAIDLSSFDDLFAAEEDETEDAPQQAVEPAPVPAEDQGPLLLLDAEGVIAPLQGRDGLWTLPNESWHALYDPQATAILDDAEFRKAWHTDRGTDAISAWGDILEINEALVGTSDIHGWWKIDAALEYVQQNPSTRVVWADSALAKLDVNTGMTFAQRATELFAERGITLITVVPESEYGLDAESAEMVVLALQGFVDEVPIRRRFTVAAQELGTEDSLELPDLPELPDFEPPAPAPPVASKPLPAATAPAPRKARKTERVISGPDEEPFFGDEDIHEFVPWDDVRPKRSAGTARTLKSGAKRFENPPKRGRRAQSE